MALAQPREDREEDDPMKHRPTALAELRTKSFAATGALVSVTVTGWPARCCLFTSCSFHDLHNRFHLACHKVKATCHASYRPNGSEDEQRLHCWLHVLGMQHVIKLISQATGLLAVRTSR